MNKLQESCIGHYLGKGLSKDVAVGIVAVLMVESGLDPNAENNSGTDAGGVLNSRGAYGLGQWNGPRQQALADFATRKGASSADLTTQLDFVLTESANSYPAVWEAMRRPGIAYADFVLIFVDIYENPADKAGEIAKALAYAKDFYAATIEPLPIAPTPTPTPFPMPIPAPVPSPVPAMKPITVSISLTFDPSTQTIEGLTAGVLKSLAS